MAEVATPNADTGRVLWALCALTVGGALVTLGGGGLVGPVAAGGALGAGAFVIGAEVLGLVRARRTTVARAASLAVGGALAAVVVVVADGLVEASLPAVVVGSGLGAIVSGAAMYGEHVVAVEGPGRALPAASARAWLAWRDLFLAFAGPPLQETSAPPQRRLPSRKT